MPRESGASSIPEIRVIEREAASYFIAAMTIC
jgi:hypothetical protein